MGKRNKGNGNGDAPVTAEKAKTPDVDQREDIGSTPATKATDVEAEPGVFIAQYTIPHHTDASKIYPGGGVSFEITKADLEDPWIVMQIESGVFMPR